MKTSVLCFSAGYCIMILSVSLSGRRTFVGAFTKYCYFHFHHGTNANKAVPRRTRLYSDKGANVPMENLYQSWTVEQDRYLFDNRKLPIATLASTLGRGLRGVDARLAKLKDVNSSAYLRLFAGLENFTYSEKETKLVPAVEILRRIQWDSALTKTDFSVLHYDRVEDKVMESPMDAPNNSVSGKEKFLAMAIPEHRIVGIKYKEQIVWDRVQRLDRVFGSMNGRGETITQVMASYVEWKKKKDSEDEISRQRQVEVSNRIQLILGQDRFASLKELSSDLILYQALPNKNDIERYVNAVLQLFRDARSDVCPVPSLLVPSTDVRDLDLFSELVAFLPNSNYRPVILMEISSVMHGFEVKNKNESRRDDQLPELKEDELMESFVRGSGPGGQKVNKTSNKVVLVHKPTQLRVECHDTRSVLQNRKIARRRLQLKLDELLNGNQSKTAIKATEVASKKAKAKTRNKARQRKKKEDTGQPEERDTEIY